MVCMPRKVASRITSRHHTNIVRPISMMANGMNVIEEVCSHSVRENISNPAPIDPVKGHGLTCTRWNGCVIYRVICLAVRIRRKEGAVWRRLTV